MQGIGYGDASQVLSDRIRWARALLAQLIDRGREEGWVPGTRTPLAADPRAIEDEIATRLESTLSTPIIVPMEWLALRLELSGPELAALWLLSCVEVSPALSRLAHALGTADGPELSLQIVRQLIPLNDLSLDSLERRGLIELTDDHDRGHHRRTLRASDRVVAVEIKVVVA
ncbi:MAG: hypothetical protein SFX73_15080 [Kofleriaceae bacterium]|nr:hypothetical protein [Kofleriaceae bacterium]